VLGSSIVENALFDVQYFAEDGEKMALTFSFAFLFTFSC